MNFPARNRVNHGYHTCQSHGCPKWVQNQGYSFLATLAFDTKPLPDCRLLLYKVEIEMFVRRVRFNGSTF